MSTATPLLVGFSSKRLTFSICSSYHSPALMSRSALLVSKKKTDSVILCDGLFAKWWSSREDRLEVQLGAREMTEEEEKFLVFGWPTDRMGVWVLRYESDRQLPKDFERMSLAMNMEEKIQMMREYGATLVEDITQVEELRDS